MRSQTRPADAPRVSRRVSRRTALGLGLGAATTVAAGGCALNNPLHEEKTPAARAVRDLAPDVGVAVQAATLLRGAVAAVTATSQQHPGLAARLAPLLAAHQTHLDRVITAVPDRVDTSGSAAPYTVPPRPAAAITRLRSTEVSVHDQLLGLALKAQSGAFARLLGAMAAATSQQLQVLAR